MDPYAYEDRSQDEEQERAYWAREDARHAFFEERITEMKRELADLREWVGELADDMLDRGAA